VFPREALDDLPGIYWCCYGCGDVFV